MGLSRSTDHITGRQSRTDETISLERDERIARHRSYNISRDHSGSLSSLPLAGHSITSMPNKNSYRNSLNDATSLQSSRVADDFDHILHCITTDDSTNNDREQEENSAANAVIPLTKEVENTSGEALQLYDFGQRDERAHHYHHHHHHHKQYCINSKESNHQAKEDENYESEEDGNTSIQPDLMNVKKETSV